jgi:hypothetical protein
MLEATRQGFLGSRYDIHTDGRPVATWNSKFWRSGGEITLAGHPYHVDATTFTRKFTMRDAHGTVVATAEKAGRKDWTVVADGKPHRFRRSSIWGNRQDLLVGDNTVGSIRRTGFWRNTVEADLPTLSLPAQVFVIGVMVTVWNSQDAAAAGASSSGG